MFYYYNEQQVKKAIVAFGSLFARIGVQRRELDGKQVSPPFIVPIRYSPGGLDYILGRERGSIDTDSDDFVFVKTIPRIGFELVSFSLDVERQKTRYNTYSFKVPSDPNVVVSQPEGVPVLLGFSLYVLTKTASDMFTIIEQIIPFFKPSIDVTVSGDPFPCDIDTVVTLQGVSIEDNYEEQGEGEARRLVATLDFQMTFMLFPGIDITPEEVDGDEHPCLYDISGGAWGTSPVINKVKVDLHKNEATFEVDGVFVNGKAAERVVVKALPEGVLDPDLSTGVSVEVDDDPPPGND